MSDWARILFFFIAFFALISSAFVWGVYFLKHSQWRGFGIYSLATAVLSTILLIVMISTAATREGVGIYQRTFLATLYLWIRIFAYRNWRHTDRVDA